MSDLPQAGFDAGREALRRFLAGDDDLTTLHTKIALIATETVPGCDFASVTMLKFGKPTTPVCTHKTAKLLDEKQYELGDGPCLAAMRHRGLEHVSTASEERWPTFVSAAAENGVHAVMSVPLGNHETVVGALNLYSQTAAGYDDAACDIACTFADQLGVAVASATLYAESFELAHQLQQAMESRAVIEQAKGILMAVHRVTADDAMKRLIAESQHTNVKLRDVAARFVEGLSSAD